MAYKVKIVKWFFCLGAWLLLPVVLLRADQATDLYNKGVEALKGNDYQTATQNFDQILTNFPSTPIIHQVRIQDGLAYLHLGNFAKTVEVLSKEALPGTPTQGTALFYTALAQLQLANKQTNDGARNTAFAQAAATMTKLITAITSAPTDENRQYLEEAYYNRALAEFYQDKLSVAEEDAQRLLQPPFNNSLSRPDYLLLLGNLYARETGEQMSAKKPADFVQGLAAKAIDAFDRASNDPNALVQANEARLAKAQLLFLVASLDLPSIDGYQKALDAFHAVRRKADLIPLQEQHVKDLITRNQSQLQSGVGGTTLATENSRLIERETGRLADLKDAPDPIVQALIGIAQCYNSMKQGDDSRTVLHRLAQASLTPEQQQQVDFALIYSYVLGGETAKADTALNEYHTKHPNDKQTEGLNVQMAADLIDRKDYQGALHQAEHSLELFPQGQYAAEAIELKAQALTGMGQLDAAKSVEDDYLRANPTSPVALGLLLSRAQGETAKGDLNAALADYGKVKDATGATPQLQSSGTAGYIQTLQTLNRSDEVIRESQTFATKYPTSPLLPNVLVMSAVSMDKKHDPGAVAALQDVARKFPADEEGSPAPFALFYVVNIYQRSGNVPAMIQAANDLAKAFPARYSLLLEAADDVGAAYLKEKKFDLAIAEYQPLTTAPQADVAATARAKIGDIWLKSAKSLGAYQSMQQQAQRDEAEKQLGSAEQSFLDVLKNNGDQLTAVDEALQGLVGVMLQRRSWGLLKEPDFEAYLTKATVELTDPGIQTRIELAKADLVFHERDGAKHYPEALARFRAAIAANASLPLTRTESNHYGELLLAAKDYPTARQVYNTLLEGDPRDPYTEADAYYGLGASYLAEGNVAEAKNYFEKMKALPGGAAWNGHILEANYGLAYAAEQAGQPADRATAKAAYSALMQSSAASVPVQAKAMLGYARILALEGHTTAPEVAGTMESAVTYDRQVDTLFGLAVPELSAEGLYQAGQLYDKAGDKANAQLEYQAVLKTYQDAAPDWAAKAKAALGQ
jgi:tetratricopeptide (TPR) repeat protein